MNQLPINNQISQETIVNTRKELWNTLFCWIDFTKTQWKNKVYNKEQQFWPMPQTFIDWQKETTKLFINKHTEIENLIDSFKPYFTSDIIPILKNKYGDKTLAFRCERLLDNKMVGEASSLFPDALSNNSGELVIFEIEYRQQQKFKEYLTRLESVIFANETVNSQWKTDLEKMQEGKINYSLVKNSFWFKWREKIENQDLVKEIDDYLKLWQRGKGATSQWKNKLKAFAMKIDEYFTKGAGENMFFQLGFIKKQAKWQEKWMELDGLIISTQNRKGWDLLNPYLMLFWFHQKPSSNNTSAYRGYFVNSFSMTSPRNLYVVLDLKEDWIWKNYGRTLLSPGSLDSNNHPIYHERNLPTTITDKKLHYPFCLDLGDKEVYYLDSSFQPQYDLYVFNHPNWIEKLSDILESWANGTNYNLDLPGSGIFPRNIYKIEKYKHWTSGFWKKGITLFLAPSDFYKGKTFLGLGTEVSNNFYEHEELVEFTFRINPSNSEIINKIYENFDKYNHLLDHSTFQSFFCHDLLEPANLRYLDFRKEGTEWKLKCVVKTKATIAGIYYFFYSGSIEWRLRLEVKQTVPAVANLKALLTGAAVVCTASFAVAAVAGVAGAATTSGGSTGLVVSGKSTAGGASMTQKATVGRAIGRGLRQKVDSAISEKKAEDIQDASDNEVGFSFGLFDFWSKMKEKQLWGKIYVSNTLKNNLVHNNNENPITYPLNITFDKLWKILKRGEYQGNLKLYYDPGSYLSDKFREGITFFEDKEKDFVTPELGLKQSINLISYDLAHGRDFISEEIREEEVVEVDRSKGGNYHQRVHYLIEYEDGSKEHWLGLLPMFQDSELADGHTHGTFNLYFDKPVKYFWDVYTCIGCGARGQFSDLHNGYDGNQDSWDTLYKNLPVEPWFSDVGNTASLKWNGRNMGASFDVWAGRKEERPNGKPFSVVYGFIPMGGVIRWRLGSTGIRFQTVPQQNDFSGLNWQPTTGATEDIRPTTTAFNFTEEDIPDASDIPETDSDSRDPGTGEPETVIEPDITVEPDAPEPEPEVPDIEVPEPEITPPEPEPEGDADTDAPEADTDDHDVPDPDEFPDSADGD